MSNNLQTKKSSPRSLRSTRKTVRIDSTKNVVKEFTKVDPTLKGDLWTTRRDVENAKEDAGILSLRRIQEKFKDKFGRYMAMKELEERSKKGKNIRNYVQKTIESHNKMKKLRNQLLEDVKTLAKHKFQPEEDVIQLKRQPPVDKSMLEIGKSLTIKSKSKSASSVGTRKSGGYKIIKKGSKRLKF